MEYKGYVHQEIFERTVRQLPKAPSDRMAAALYLLTADCSAWKAVRNHIEKNHIRFENVKLSDVTVGGYVLYEAARDLYANGTKMTVSDLANRGIVSDRTYRLIVTAIDIRRNGLRKEGKEADGKHSKKEERELQHSGI